MLRAALGVLGLGALVAALGGEGRADDKGPVVELGGLKSQAPAAWKEESPTNKMRSHQFRLPKAEGDRADAELVIFFFGGSGGGTEDNIKRWKGMFVAPAGKSIDDVSKVEKLKVADQDVTYLDVQGTYLYKERPFDPQAKAERRPEYRMLGVVFETPKGPYFLRLVGPAKTVAHYKKGFDEWLKGFKK